jgi:hypothetical protein
MVLPHGRLVPRDNGGPVRMTRGEPGHMRAFEKVGSKAIGRVHSSTSVPGRGSGQALTPLP